MFATATKLAIVTALLALVTVTADAQQRIPPRCSKAKDKTKCSCFYAARGQIVNNPGGSRRAIIRDMHDVDRYVACMRRNGRPNG
jgi:hypothetical protein